MDDIEAVLITTDGKVEAITLPRDDTQRLDVLQQHVGGLIEAVHILRDDGNCADAIINEEGKIIDLEPNELATEVVGRENLFPGDYIAGPAVIIGAPDEDGVETSIPEDLAHEIVALAEYRARMEHDYDFGIDL